MAFEDVYAEVLSTSDVAGYYDSVNDEYMYTLLDLLPPGPIWVFEDGSEMRGLLEALSYHLCRVAERALDLFEEIDPRTAFELLDDWERVLGLPGADNPDPPTTTADRRSAIHGQLLGHGDPTPTFFEDVADGLGYTATVAHKQHSQFVPGSASGDPLTQHEWMFVWYIATLGVDDTDETFKWALRRLVPSHTRLVFRIAAETWDVATEFFGGTDAITTIFYGNGIYVAAGNNGDLETSADGVTWVIRTSGFGTTHIKTGMEATGLLVVVGNAGKLSTSTDGVTWTLRTSQFGADAIYAITHADGMFVIAGGTGKISTSPDGITWTARTAAGAYAGTFLASMYGRSLYIIAGTAGELQTSPDGITWTARVSQFGADIIRGIEYGYGTLVAYGANGKISSSTDGTTWTSRTSQFGSDTIWSMAYGGGLFVAVGGSGKLSTSPDGETWTAQTSQFGADTINNVDYMDGLFVAVGSSGKVSVSEDGETWTSRDASMSTSEINRVGHGPYRFVAGTTDGKIATTPYGEL